MSDLSSYSSPYGTWKVTTEGDCGTRDLGIHKGYFDKIAFALADKVLYNLQFTKIADIEDKSYVPTRDSVDISFNIDSETWNMTPEQRVQFFEDLLGWVPMDDTIGTKVYKSNYYASVQLSLPENSAKVKEMKRAQVLAKLSKEERELLGL